MSTEQPVHDDGADDRPQDAGTHRVHSGAARDGESGGPDGSGGRGGPGGPGGPPPGEDSGDPGGKRPHRKRIAIAVVAAAVLLAGGGGAYVAATTPDGQGSSGASGDGHPPPLALDGYSEDGHGTGSGTGDGSGSAGNGSSGGAGIAPGEPDPNGVTYRLDAALPKGPSSAPVYHAQGSVPADEVAKLAKALGVAGTPRMSGGSWQVGSGKDGSGPVLRVTAQTPGTWTFARYTAGGSDDCPRGKECSSSPSGTGPAVSEQAARAAAAPVLKAVGQDGAKLDTTQTMGAERVVNADPEVGGLPTYGWSTGIRVGGNGTVVGGSGRMLAPSKGETYPVLGAEETLKLLNKSRHGTVAPGGGGCGTVMPQKGQPTPRQGCVHLDGTGAGADAGSGPSPSARVVPVKGAAFGLAAHLVAGHQALVPSWLFEVRPQGAQDSFTVTYPAVDPAYLTGGNPSGTAEPVRPGGKGVHLSSYTANGRSLTVQFWGGVCTDYTASAAETGDKVTVTVSQHQKDPGKACVMIAKKIEKTVTLHQPLGDRKVVDATGAQVRKG
ncbi:hypothetical protein [Streptomyces sp. TS71-3]|uniref:hypothetical protein n=1 Tax=Streptomyces sp. TS71-3 TaxID=2733862 RepID=UPI001B1BAB5B|nr:hypothetical protein [Streptomyces sp. TS71-3]GHJ38151.1 membrane protein [Streptomyces sp. TS71-3]